MSQSLIDHKIDGGILSINAVRWPIDVRFIAKNELTYAASFTKDQLRELNPFLADPSVFIGAVRHKPASIESRECDSRLSSGVETRPPKAAGTAGITINWSSDDPVHKFSIRLIADMDNRQPQLRSPMEAGIACLHGRMHSLEARVSVLEHSRGGEPFDLKRLLNESITDVYDTLTAYDNGEGVRPAITALDQLSKAALILRGDLIKKDRAAAGARLNRSDD